MRTQKIMLCTVALTLGGCSSSGMHSTSGPRYTPRADISQDNYTQENRIEDHMDQKSYEQYSQREPCQNYRKVPRNYADECVDEVMEAEMFIAAAPITPKQQSVLPIVSSYTVLFDFDKSNIRNNEEATMDQIAHEIKKYHPKQVTVTGYTDSFGDADYNQTLSREREQAASRALLTRGVMNQTLDRAARGEDDQAVQTADGVKNQKNRRVVIDFRR